MFWFSVKMRATSLAEEEKVRPSGGDFQGHVLCDQTDDVIQGQGHAWPDALAFDRAVRSRDRRSRSGCSWIFRGSTRPT